MSRFQWFRMYADISRDNAVFTEDCIFGLALFFMIYLNYWVIDTDQNMILLNIGCIMNMFC